MSGGPSDHALEPSSRNFKSGSNPSIARGAYNRRRKPPVNSSDGDRKKGKGRSNQLPHHDDVMSPVRGMHKTFPRRFIKMNRPRSSGPVGPEIDWSVRGSLCEQRPIQLLLKQFRVPESSIFGTVDIDRRIVNDRVLSEEEFSNTRPKLGCFRTFYMSDQCVIKWTHFCMTSGIQYGKDNTYLYPRGFDPSEFALWPGELESMTSRQRKDHDRKVRMYKEKVEKLNSKSLLRQGEFEVFDVMSKKFLDGRRTSGMRRRSKAARKRREILRNIRKGNPPLLRVEIQLCRGPSNRWVKREWIRAGRPCSVKDFRYSITLRPYISINSRKVGLATPFVLECLSKIYKQRQVVVPVVREEPRLVHTVDLHGRKSYRKAHIDKIHRTLFPAGLAKANWAQGITGDFPVIEVHNLVKGGGKQTVKVCDILRYGEKYWNEVLIPDLPSLLEEVPVVTTVSSASE